MASAAASQTVDSTGINVFDAADDGGKCTEFLVGVQSAATQPALVNVPGLHEANEFIGIPKGASVTFRLGTIGIATVFVKGAGGDTLIDFGVVAKFWI